MSEAQGLDEFRRAVERVSSDTIAAVRPLDDEPAAKAINAILGDWPGDIDIKRQNGMWLVELFIPSYQIGPYAGKTLSEALDKASEWTRALAAYMGK